MEYDFLYLLTFGATSNSYYVNRGWSLIGKEKLNQHPVSILETPSQRLTVLDNIMSA
jgi:hypothetical protein